MVLQSIRERLTGILAFTILGILVIPFALVGVNQYFTSSGDNIVAKVNDKEITTNEFNQSFSNYRRRMQSIMGAAYDPMQFDQLVVRREHLDNLIDQELITQAADSLGLEVDDATLAEEIRKIPAFQIDGQFNTDVYQARLLSQGMTPKQFQAEMRANFIFTELPKNIAESSIATSSEVQEFVGLFEQRRTFNAVMVPAVESDPPAEFSEEEITAWHDSHTEDYKSEEQVSIQYIELDSSQMPAGEAPDENYLHEQFEAQKARFITPEEREVAHILIQVPQGASEAEIETARQTAEDLAERARAGEDFATLAKEYSQDKGSAESGGDLGWVEPGVMVQAFEKAMYELSMDSPISDPVQTGFGWHVIELKGIREAHGMSFEEARPTLVKEYEDENRARMFLEQADRLVDLIYEDPTTLESAATVMDLPVHETAPFPRSGGEGIAANPEVVDAAFSDLVLLQGSVSDPINLDENHLVMIKLKEHLPVAVKPVMEVRDQIIATLRDNLARENAKTRADDLLAAAQAEGGDLEALATESELEYSRHELVNRNAFAPDATLVKEIFRLPEPDGDAGVEAVLPTSGGYAVVQLVTVEQGSLDGNAQVNKQQYERVIANGNASQENAALLAQLRAAANIEVFEDRIK